MKIIDLTQPLNERTPVYPKSKDKPPQLTQIAAVKENGYSSYRLTCDMHVGTHIDAPAHMIAHGKKISDFPIDTFCGPAKLIDARNHDIIDKDLLNNVLLEPDDILLIFTGFDKKYYETEYFTQHPVLSKAFVQELIRHKVKMIGLDMPSPDCSPFDQHKQLFAHNILIIENCANLDQLLSAHTIEIDALPLACNVDGALARVIAKID